MLNAQLSLSGLGTNLHYERALQEQLNGRLALGFTQEQLGEAEPEESQRIVEATAQVIVEVVDPKDPEK